MIIFDSQEQKDTVILLMRAGLPNLKITDEAWPVFNQVREDIKNGKVVGEDDTNSDT